MNVHDSSGNYRRIRVIFRDTCLLAPDGYRRLEDIGKLVGQAKVDLPEGYDKSRMDIFFDERPDEARRYLAIDTTIPIKFFQEVQKLAKTMGLDQVPATLGAFAVAKLHKILSDFRDSQGRPVSAERLFGKIRQSRERYSRRLGRSVTRTETEIELVRRLIEPFAVEGYRGGRTETFETGPSPVGVLYDVDLKNCYPSAMCAIQVPDYQAWYPTTDATEFKAGTLGFAEISFRHPPHIRFPVFGVTTPHGLVFPRFGSAVATSPEIATALWLGVEVDIHHGVIIPWADPARPYLTFGREMIELRNLLKVVRTLEDGSEIREDGLLSLIVKTIANALYGKTGQGVKHQNVYDTREGGSRQLPPSSVSCAPFAAIISGLPRAAIAEMLNRLPPDRSIISVSTDGFLTSAAIDEIDVTGPSCQVLAECRLLLTGDSSLLEAKKTVNQVVTARSRAAFTTVLGTGKPVIARGGIKVPVDSGDTSDFLVALYLDRTIDTRLDRTDLISLRDQWEENADLVPVERSPRINFEPDFKRDLLNPRMVTIAGGAHVGRNHLATSSQPYETVNDMLEIRDLFDGWRHTTGRCLKTLDDWADWTDYRESTITARCAGKRPHRTAGGSADDLKRQFLRAMVRGEWGVDSSGRSYQDVATWLSNAGYRTGVAGVKNAIRPASRLVAHSIAATEKSIALLLVILAKFPSFDWRSAYVVGHHAKVEEVLPTHLRASLPRNNEDG